MRQLMNRPLPGKSIDLIRLLDEITERAVVAHKNDIDPFELGFKAGARDLVDMLKNKIDRDH